MNRNTKARGGFTLIELLVVIFIIGVLVALFTGAAMMFRERQVERSTENRLQRWQIGLNTEYDRIVQKAQKDRVPDQVLAYCGGDPKRAKAVHTAALLRAYMPENFAELVEFEVGGYKYELKQAFKPFAGVTGPTLDQQSAILLYLILSEQSISGSTGDSGATGEETSIKIGTAANSRDVRMFQDPRGEPVLFSRWAQSNELDIAPYVNAKTGFPDPLDPEGLVATAPATGWTAALRDDLNKSPRFLKFAGVPLAGGQPLPSRNRVPTVLSKGKDKTFNNFAAGADDILGYRLDRFGKKGN